MRAKGLKDNGPVWGIGLRKRPILVHQIGQGQPPAADQGILYSGDDDVRVLEQRIYIQVFQGDRFDDVHDRQIHLAVQQGAIRGCRIGRQDLKGKAGISLTQAMDDARDESGSDCNRACDPELSSRGVGKELNIFNALSELIENRDAALQQGAAVRRGLDSMGAAVNQAHPKRVFEVCNRP